MNMNLGPICKLCMFRQFQNYMELNIDYESIDKYFVYYPTYNLKIKCDHKIVISLPFLTWIILADCHMQKIINK